MTPSSSVELESRNACLFDTTCTRKSEGCLKNSKVVGWIVVEGYRCEHSFGNRSCDVTMTSQECLEYVMTSEKMSGMLHDVNDTSYTTSELCKHLIALCVIPIGYVERVGVSIKLKPAQTSLNIKKWRHWKTCGRQERWKIFFKEHVKTLEGVWSTKGGGKACVSIKLKPAQTSLNHGMFWHWNCDFVCLWFWHRIQDSWFVLQITLTDSEESYIRKKGKVEQQG